jgi:hypothetical protein
LFGALFAAKGPKPFPFTTGENNGNELGGWVYHYIFDIFEEGAVNQINALKESRRSEFELLSRIQRLLIIRKL